MSVLRGHSVFSSPPQRSMTSDFEGFSIPDFILILEKEPVFPFLMFSAKNGTYWYHFYDSLLNSLVVECWLRVREVPGSIPSQGKKHVLSHLK